MRNLEIKRRLISELSLAVKEVTLQGSESSEKLGTYVSSLQLLPCLSGVQIPLYEFQFIILLFSKLHNTNDKLNIQKVG